MQGTSAELMQYVGSRVTQSLTSPLLLHSSPLGQLPSHPQGVPSAAVAAAAAAELHLHPKIWTRHAAHLIITVFFSNLKWLVSTLRAFFANAKAIYSKANVAQNVSKTNKGKKRLIVVIDEAACHITDLLGSKPLWICIFSWARHESKEHFSQPAP